MKKNIVIGFLLLSFGVLSACESKSTKDSSSNDIAQSTTSESVEEIQIDEEIEGQTISEHFTKELKDEIWFEVPLYSDEELSQNSRISAFMVTNEAYHDSNTYMEFIRYNPDETGYININLTRTNDNDDRPQIIDVYSLYSNRKLYKKIYDAYLNTNSSLNDRGKENFGTGRLFSPYSEELTFRHVVGADSKIKYQGIDFKGRETFTENNGYYSFGVIEDSVLITLSAEGYPELYLVGFKGFNSLTKDTTSYFLKISDKKEKITIDPMYTNDEISIVRVDE